MGKSKGSPKTGGRKKGTPNKNSVQMTEVLDNFGYNPVERLLEKYDKLSFSEQAKIDLKFIEFLYPRKKSVDVDITNETDPYKNMSLEELRSLSEKLRRENEATLTIMSKQLPV